MPSSALPELHLKDISVKYPIVQGGMGVGISSYNLAGSVSKCGGLGVLSSVALDRLVSRRYDKKVRVREACALEVRDAKEIAGGKPIGINIMVAVQKDYSESILGSLDGGVDVIISGAGLPLSLPEIVSHHERGNEVKLLPIVSSGRALDIICKKWKKSANRLPDAVVVEGPLAGGHIGWRNIDEVYEPANSLECLVQDVLEVVKSYGDIPVIAAGGVYDKHDIEKFLAMGCAGVQMGTRFLATQESGATEEYKRNLIECKEEDITLADEPGSPCKMLFRVLKDSPFYKESLAGARPEKCDKGYLVVNGKCLACQDRHLAFCICNGLMAAAGANENEKELYTVGANAYKIKEILSVSDLMKELTE